VAELRDRHIQPCDVVLVAMPLASRQNFMVSASKVQALALTLTAALTIFYHHPQTHASNKLILVIVIK